MKALPKKKRKSYVSSANSPFLHVSAFFFGIPKLILKEKQRNVFIFCSLLKIYLNQCNFLFLSAAASHSKNGGTEFETNWFLEKKHTEVIYHNHQLPSGKRSHSDGWNDIPIFQQEIHSSSIRVHFLASYVRLPECMCWELNLSSWWFFTTHLKNITVVKLDHFPNFRG